MKNRKAPVAALVEFSYPLSAAFFSWLFFRESHLNLQTAIGAALIYSGIIVVALGNRGREPPRPLIRSRT